MITRNQALCENMNKVRLRLLAAGYAKIENDRNWAGLVTRPAFSRLYYILSGDFYIIGEDDCVHVLSAGNCYLLPAEYSFRFGCRNTTEHVYFHVTLGDFHGIDMLKACPGPIGCPFPMEKTAVYRTLADTQSILGSLQTQQEVYTSLCALLETHRIPLEKKTYSPSVRTAIQYIESHLSLQLTLKEIAANSFTATSTLTRNFKRETGMTIGQYIDESVMSHAEQLLRVGNMSIQEISEKFGFCDQFYFARRFKEKFQMSPRDYRKTTLI